MKIHFDPNNGAPTGVVSFASWENRDLQEALRKAFNESPREQITEIWINRDGIKAVFESKDACKR